jgi:hypothetical protein
MAIQRNWVTPLAAGAFLLSAVTGILMFFHFDSGLNKLAHEWLSWVLLGAVALHVTANFDGFKRHLGTRRGQLLVGLFALVLLSSFVGSGEKDEPPFGGNTTDDTGAGGSPHARAGAGTPGASGCAARIRSAKLERSGRARHAQTSAGIGNTVSRTKVAWPLPSLGQRESN